MSTFILNQISRLAPKTHNRVRSPKYKELVASFHECQHGSPWPSWRPRAVARGDAVRKMRGTPRQRGGWQAHDQGMLCSCTPEMYEPHIHACSPHVSRG